ncbi:hypothetical protein M3182_11305 [Mesobacillus maritimus]|uniref:hypothetical protein n=1 Tax=Mesobacillus maritimus TaxID=1643336 RepID=UPI00203DBB6D|nr:hypothetical protein [Mesobacillus maritimus]MCM3586318.1 hypothetical protein [Mesobacillus maritimus]MCM3671714.1 hypothetical protein [Mesobacillus maritimus]
MKKLAGFLFIVLVLYSIYNDLSNGSLPTSSNNSNAIEAKAAPQEVNTKETKPFFEKEILPGDTVLSVLEMQLNASLPVPISQAITDFADLNNGTTPEEIMIGQTYKFPDYTQAR